MQADELSARRLAQGKDTIPGALRGAERVFASVNTGHTILLPHREKNCEKYFWMRMDNLLFHMEQKVVQARMEPSAVERFLLEPVF
jgi:hypothetical protein